MNTPKTYKWYEDPVYIKMCDCEEIQSLWEPCIGDYMLRKYTVFGEPLDTEIWGDNNKPQIEILHYHSDIPQYWSSVTPDGKSQIVEFPDSAKMDHSSEKAEMPHFAVHQYHQVAQDKDRQEVFLFWTVSFEPNVVFYHPDTREGSILEIIRHIRESF